MYVCCTQCRCYSWIIKIMITEISLSKYTLMQIPQMYTYIQLMFTLQYNSWLIVGYFKSAEQHILTINTPTPQPFLANPPSTIFPPYLFLINALSIREAVGLHWQDHRLPNQNECEPCHRLSCWARPLREENKKNSLSLVQLISPSLYYYWIKISL